MLLFTLEYGINIQVVINIQVGYFLQSNKHTGLNKRTDGNLENRNLTLNRATLVIPVVAKHELFRYEYNKGLITATSWKTISRFLLFDINLRFLFLFYDKIPIINKRTSRIKSVQAGKFSKN